MSVNDNNNKVGIRLIAKKKKGFFNFLEGQRIYGENSFSSDDSYKLQYTSNGKLKKKTSKFILTCEY